MQNAEMIRFSQDRESSIKRVAPLSVSDVLAGEEVRAKWISSPRHDRCAGGVRAGREVERSESSAIYARRSGLIICGREGVQSDCG